MTHTAPHSTPLPLDEDDVVDFLSEHPDLLQRHPELLTQLELRHECGGATSLIEHQVQRLRDESRTLRLRLDELLRIARYNDSTAEQLHQITVALLSAPDLQGALEALRAGLREGFRAEAVGLLLIRPPGSGGDAAPIAELLGEDDPVLEPFYTLLTARKPVCGAPTDAQRAAIFAASAERVASAALVPMVERRCVGLLGIGSADPHHYHAGQGTLFLRRLGSVAAAVIDRLLPQA